MSNSTRAVQTRGYGAPSLKIMIFVTGRCHHNKMQLILVI